MFNNIKSICIVGGGSSGWMTAAAIVKNLPNIKLTLIESPNLPIIGVGESTIGHINQYMHYIGLKDEDWMAACNATYKTSIKFQDFRETPTEKPHVFHYPFGIFDFTDKPRGLMEWFLIKAAHPDIDCYNFAEFYHDSVMMTDAGKMTKNLDNKIRGFDFDFDTAYHMDATAFGIYLRDKICLPAGMTHLLDDVVSCRQDDTGKISAIETKSSGTLIADLYIDCTGFKSLLLEETLKVPFISFGDTLLNDSAIATVIPYIDRESEMECVTSCTAIESGWVWNIPLWHRIGTGYVYSSKFATKEQAEEQFRRHLKSNRMVIADNDRADAAEFRHIKIKHGVHERAWEKNVVGIGLSNGFIEPLESTGLMLTHEAIIKLISTLKMREGRVTRFDIDLFNHALREQVIGFKHFISQHYALSCRNDTPYWQAVSSRVYSESMNTFEPELYNSYTALADYQHRLKIYGNGMSGIVYIMAGMGYTPTDTRHSTFLDRKYRETDGYREKSLETWKQHRALVLEHIKTLPSHYEFLKQTIYANTARRDFNINHDK